MCKILLIDQDLFLKTNPFVSIIMYVSDWIFTNFCCNVWVIVILKQDQETKQPGKGVLEFVKPNAICIRQKGKQEINRYYDHVFWSCDGYQKREDGYLEPNGPQSDYADQVTLPIISCCYIPFFKSFFLLLRQRKYYRRSMKYQWINK